MRPAARVIVGVLVLACAMLAISAATARPKKKRCKPLCRATIASCIQEQCGTLTRKAKSRCKASCRRQTLAACRADPDLTECVAGIVTPSYRATVAGRVVRTDPNSQSGIPVSGARVRATVDGDGSGGVGDGEAVETATAGDGTYSFDVPIAAGHATVIHFEASGYAPLLRTLRPAGNAVIELNANLRAMGVLDCSGGKCVGPGDGLSVFGLDPGISGTAASFDPTTQADAAPGAALDVSGRLLHSTVFGVVQLTDTAGNPVTTLSQPATLCFAIPDGTRATVADVAPGDGTIEMPLFYFDDVRGAWVEDGRAVVQTADGTPVPEASLGAVRDGTLPGPLQACGVVTHFTWWNVASVVDQVACLSVDVRDTSGSPASGAVVSFIGETYPAFGELVPVGSDGSVCGQVPRSEGPNEDLDGDGVPGEVERTRVRVWFQGKVYDGGDYADDVQAGACPCAPQTIQLDPSRELGKQLCAVVGRVVDGTGAPQVGFEVFGYDPGVSSDTYVALCTTQVCEPIAQTDDAGGFTLAVPVIDDLELFAIGVSVPSFGTLSVSGCPGVPVEIVATPDVAP